MNNSRIIVALDFSSTGVALEHVRLLEPGLCRLKVGKELFTSGGPAIVESLIDMGFDVFLDLKFHDIPNTVARACSAAARLGVWMLNIHACGGRNMLVAAKEAIAKEPHQPLLIGVTVLTSMSTEDLSEIGIDATAEVQVKRLAKLTRDSGLDGIVCSAQEAASLRAATGEDFILVTPGIRPAGVANHDQKRTMTPAEAIIAGSHYLVIGRPIIQAQDPLKVLLEINEAVNAALVKRESL